MRWKRIPASVKAKGGQGVAPSAFAELLGLLVVLLQAQARKQKIIGSPTPSRSTNSIKQAAEFGIVRGGQKLAGLLLTLAEVNGLGLEAAAGPGADGGLLLGSRPTRAATWPTGTSSVLPYAEHDPRRHLSAPCKYLKAVKAAGTGQPKAVARKLKELPVDDLFAQAARYWENGRMVHDLYLFEVKKPSESKKPGITTSNSRVPATSVPIRQDSGCPLTSRPVAHSTSPRRNAGVHNQRRGKRRRCQVAQTIRHGVWSRRRRTTRDRTACIRHDQAPDMRPSAPTQRKMARNRLNQKAAPRFSVAFA